MKTCPQCNAIVSDTAKFCIKCGFNIKKYEEENVNQKLFCPECGEQVPVEADFCPECGAKIEKEGFLNNDSSGTEIDFSALANINVELAKQLKEKEFSAFEYDEHSDGSYTITGLKDKTALKYVVPDKVEGIANGAFKGSEAITVTLPEGLMKIGDQAFKDCKNLTQINLPKSLKFIGNEAFFNCELLNIEIPSYVIRVGSNAIKNTLKDLERQKAEAEAKAKKEAEERALKEAEAKMKAEAEAKKEREETARKEAEEKERWQAEAKLRKTVGSTITFGSYYQSNKKQKEALKWQVLAVEGNKSLLISEKILESKAYNESWIDVIWETSSIRRWLNNAFKNLVFSTSEQQRIQAEIFILSPEEAKRYFATDSARACLATPYAKTKGIWVGDNGNSLWWLCSPGYIVSEFCVEIDGSIGRTNDRFVDHYRYGVRPALWINNE